MVKPKLSIFTGLKTLGTVYRENNQINIKFTEFNVPFTTTAGNSSVNWKGKTRIIMVQGAHDGNGFDGVTDEGKLSDFIFEMEEWVNAAVQPKIVYTDSFDVGYNVYCVDWSWTRSFADPNRILWTLLMKEA